MSPDHHGPSSCARRRPITNYVMAWVALAVCWSRTCTLGSPLTSLHGDRYKLPDLSRARHQSRYDSTSDFTGDFLRDDFRSASLREQSLLLGQLERLQRLVEKFHRPQPQQQQQQQPQQQPSSPLGDVSNGPAIYGGDPQLDDVIDDQQPPQQPPQVSVLGPRVEVQLPRDDQLRRGLEALRRNQRFQKKLSQHMQRDLRSQGRPVTSTVDLTQQQESLTRVKLPQGDSERRRLNLLAKRDAGQICIWKVCPPSPWRRHF